GSTGRPKGVAMPHRPLVNLLDWQLRQWRHPAAAATLQFTTLSFDVAFQEIFSTWHAGGRLVLLSEEERRDLGEVLERIDAARIERLFLPAVALQHLAELAEERGRFPSALREVQTAGEQLRVTDTLRRFFAETGAILSNQYGPSETHVATALLLPDETDEWPALPGIGVPVANARTYVLDGAGNPAPAGVPGELYLAGVCVARGYLARPALTAERFVPDAFGAAGSRAYRTGDRARWLADGTLEFLGRVDDQVKVRGFRIEPGEVEAALQSHPSVRQAVVVVREDAPGDRRLVGYVVPAPDAEVGDAALRAHLAGRLPGYMVPGAFVVMDAFPLTPSGKVARRALPAPAVTASAGDAAPRTPAEEIVAGIFATVLRVDGVGAHGDFFALGGHSLLATRVVSRIRQAFGVELPLRALFEAPTVAGLAARIEGLRRTGEASVAPPLVPVPRDGDLPLSFAQERLWFVDQLEPNSAAYNLPYALRVRGGLDAARLGDALTALVARHEALRTVFPAVDGAPVQRILPPSPLALREHDLRHLPAQERERAALRLAAAEAETPFDLANGPLVRAGVVRIDDDDVLLLLTLHHVASDGWSQDLLARDLTELYAALAEGRDANLPHLPVQYADFAVWQRAWVSGEVLDRHVAYWRHALAGAPPLLELPTDRPRTVAGGARAETRSFLLSAQASDGVRALARAEGATLFMTLLAGFQAVLGRWAGQDDVVVGTSVAGRGRLEVENLIGFFVNMLPLRADLSGDPGFRALVARVRNTVLEAHAHEELPFERLVDELQTERSLLHSPVFQVEFGVRTDAREALRLGAADAAPAGEAGAQAKYDLSLYCAEQGGRIAGTLIYRAELFDGATMERMAGHLERFLAAASADPDAPLSSIALADGEERRRVVEAWNQTDFAFPGGVCAHELFEAQAARTPAALAVEWGGERLSYAELDARADALARRLVRRGVGPETRVGVLLERSLEMVVSVLAVMKAGGCCVPVDTSYPAERMRLMLADAAVRVLVTDGPLSEVIGGEGLDLLRVDVAEEEDGDAAPVRGRAIPGTLAYVFYTSGSTGRPKGVMMGHREVVQFAWCVTECMPLGPGDRVAQASNASFDAAVFEIWCAFAHGATLVG
ncbi:MAG: AMP-binding protein, partial [Gemmatimonadetes bacterium]|nr:AMP-binding protein [Gemmatimonadota bacterium]